MLGRFIPHYCVIISCYQPFLCDYLYLSPSCSSLNVLAESSLIYFISKPYLFFIQSSYHSMFWLLLVIWVLEFRGELSKDTTKLPCSHNYDFRLVLLFVYDYTVFLEVVSYKFDYFTIKAINLSWTFLLSQSQLILLLHDCCTTKTRYRLILSF